MDLTRGERLQIMLTEEELAALDDWRFKHRMPSRAAAIRELLKRGLADAGLVATDGRTRSKDFGVTDAGFAEPGITDGKSDGKADGKADGQGDGQGL